MKPLEPAHPWIADALCALGRNFADSAEPIVEHPVFLTLGAIAAVGLFVCSRMGLV